MFHALLTDLLLQTPPLVLEQVYLVLQLQPLLLLAQVLVSPPAEAFLSDWVALLPVLEDHRRLLGSQASHLVVSLERRPRDLLDVVDHQELLLALDHLQDLLHRVHLRELSSHHRDSSRREDEDFPHQGLGVDNMIIRGVA